MALTVNHCERNRSVRRLVFTSLVTIRTFPPCVSPWQGVSCQSLENFGWCSHALVFMSASDACDPCRVNPPPKMQCSVELSFNAWYPTTKSFMSGLIENWREMQRRLSIVTVVVFPKTYHVMMMQKFVKSFFAETRLADGRLLRLSSSHYWTNRTRTVRPITLQLSCIRRIGVSMRRKFGRSSKKVGSTVDVVSMLVGNWGWALGNVACIDGTTCSRAMVRRPRLAQRSCNRHTGFLSYHYSIVHLVSGDVVLWEWTQTSWRWSRDGLDGTSFRTVVPLLLLFTLTLTFQCQFKQQCIHVFVYLGDSSCD